MTVGVSMEGGISGMPKLNAEDSQSVVGLSYPLLVFQCQNLFGKN